MPIQLFLLVFSFWLIICTSCQKQSPELSVTSEDKTVKKEKLPIHQKQNNLNVREPKASENDKLILTDQEWREKLTTQEYLILRQKGTERPFSNEMKNLGSGTFIIPCPLYCEHTSSCMFAPFSCFTHSPLHAVRLILL